MFAKMYITIIWFRIFSLPLTEMPLYALMVTLHSLLSYVPAATATAAKSLQSCPTLCDPIDGSPPGFPVPGILQARILEWVAISFSNAWRWKEKVKSLSWCLTLTDPMDCSLSGSSIHGIFQARVLEWGAIAFSFMSLVLSQNYRSIFCSKKSS